jgi:hypothetical protein
MRRLLSSTRRASSLARRFSASTAGASAWCFNACICASKSAFCFFNCARGASPSAFILARCASKAAFFFLSWLICCRIVGFFFMMITATTSHSGVGILCQQTIHKQFIGIERTNQPGMRPNRFGIAPRPKHAKLNGPYRPNGGIVWDCPPSKGCQTGLAVEREWDMKCGELNYIPWTGGTISNMLTSLRH